MQLSKVFCLFLYIQFVSIALYGQYPRFKADYIINDISFRVDFYAQNDEFVGIISGKEKKDTIRLVDLKYEIFTNKFETAITSNKFLETTVTTEISTQSNKVFYDILLWKTSISSKPPVAGFFRVRRNLPVYSNVLSRLYQKRKRMEKIALSTGREKRRQKAIQRAKELKEEYDSLKQKLVYFSAIFKVDSFSMEITQGSIRNMILFGRFVESDTSNTSRQTVSDAYDLVVDYYKGQKTYRNLRPIGLSSFSDIKSMRLVRLVNLHDEFNQFDIELRYLLDYNPKLHLKTDDYSPADSVYFIKPNPLTKEFDPVIIAYREKDESILTGRIYTDLMGISSTAPNGLIQTEISKSVLINSQESWFTFFNNVEIKSILSKIEDKERTLEIVSDTVNSLDLINYSWGSFMSDLNFFKVDIPRYRINIANTFRGGYLLTQMKDSINDVESKGSYLYGNSSIIQFTPDFRWGFDIRYSFNRIKAVDNSIQAQNNTVHTVELNAFWKPDVRRANEMFFKVGSYFDNRRKEFFRLQIGYAFKFLKK